MHPGKPASAPLTLPPPTPTAVEEDWSLIGRFAPPGLRVETVVRADLLDRMVGPASPPLLLVISPPGFGKTTLLTQLWRRLRQEDESAAGWLTLDEDDSEVTRFVAHLIMAVRQAGLELGQLPRVAEQQLSQADVDTTLLNLLHFIQRAPRRLTLILDDLHRVKSAAVDRVLDQMVRHAGPRFSLVISGRERPRLAMAGLEARGLVTMVEAADLRLSAAAMTGLFPPDLPEADLALLHARTEGWPVAIQLAKLWLERGGERRHQISGFSGRTVEVARYLLEQVLGDLEPELQDFLVETSILERFDGTLADGVRGRDDSHALLALLAPLDALLVPLDGAREWFRYHHMFADYLRQRLLQRGSSGMNELHRRAARHLAAQGQTLDAVRHAQKGGDLTQAIDLVANAGGWRIILGQGIGFARNLLANFNEETIRTSPVLLLTQGYLHMKHGDLEQARRLVDQAAMIRSDTTRHDQVVVEALMRTYSDQVDDPAWRATLTADIAAMPAGDHLGRATLRAAAVVADLGTADFATADRESRRGMMEMQAAGSILGATYFAFHLAQSLFYRGQVGEAERTMRAALVTAEEHYGSDSALRAVSSCLLGHILYWRNDLAEAQGWIAAALDAIESHDGWMDIYAVSYRTAMALDLVQGGRAAAQTIIDHAEANARKRGLSGLSALAAAWKLDLLLALDAGAEADAWVRQARLEERFRRAQAPGDWRLSMTLGLGLAQWHLRAGRAAAALKFLPGLRAHCTAQERHFDRARLDLLIAVACQQRGDQADAAAHMTMALDLIAAERLPRLLLDVAVPKEPLLHLALSTLPETGDARADLLSGLLDSLRGDAAPVSAEGLSARELAVLQQLCQGHSNKLISWHLGLSENTVKFHLKRIFAKLGVTSRAEAVAAATQRGLTRG